MERHSFAPSAGAEQHKALDLRILTQAGQGLFDGPILKPWPKPAGLPVGG
jgi:hypothetical protein